MASIIILATDENMIELLKKTCYTHGHECLIAYNEEHAKTLIDENNNASLFIDLQLFIGIEKKIIDKMLVFKPDLLIICFMKKINLSLATSLLRAGVKDVLSWPLDVLDLNTCLENIFSKDKTKLKDSNKNFVDIIGQSEAIKKIFKLVNKIAETDSTVLIHGESGTGKELIAKAIHESSLRSNNRLIPVNCGAIPEELLETELFGHEKGAFTNAIRTRIGRFEMADKSTIFLDEIGDMSPKLQVKLLRVLQEHEFERVGGDKTIKVDIRIIAATNVDLAKAVSEGRFREDLYYRLNVIPIVMPPLRERLSDIPLLVNAFLKKFRNKKISQVKTVDKKFLNQLTYYSWPGNIRELENLIERLVILADNDTLTLDDLPSRFCQSSESDKEKLNFEANNNLLSEKQFNLKNNDLVLPVDFNALVNEYEEFLIKLALEKTNGVKNRAAQLLGLNRTTLVEKMRKKGLA